MPPMPLRVMAATPAVGPADLVRLYHRARLQLARAIAEETPLDGGTWLHNPALQPLPGANCVLDAATDDPAALIAETGSPHDPVRGWTLNPSAPPERTVPLAEHLARSGWHPAGVDVLHLARGRPPGPVPPGLTVLPVRAAYGPLARLLADRYPPVEQEAFLRQLDDAHLDGWIALEAATPVGLVTMLTDGETGTVADLYVVPDRRRRGIGRHLLDRCLEVSGRAGLRHVLAGTAGPGPFAAAGFEPVGRWVQYVGG